MTNKDFAASVTKFFYYANNYNCVAITYNALGRGEVTEYLPEFFKAFQPMAIDHLWGKFNSYYEEYRRSAAAMIEWFAALDGSNRARLLKWINENYKQSESFGINLSMAE